MRWIVPLSHHQKGALKLKIALTILAPSFLSEEIERTLLWTSRIL